MTEISLFVGPPINSRIRTDVNGVSLKCHLPLSIKNCADFFNWISLIGFLFYFMFVSACARTTSTSNRTKTAGWEIEWVSSGTFKLWINNLIRLRVQFLTRFFSFRFISTFGDANGSCLTEIQSRSAIRDRRIPGHESHQRAGGQTHHSEADSLKCGKRWMKLRWLSWMLNGWFLFL